MWRNLKQTIKDHPLQCGLAFIVIIFIIIFLAVYFGRMNYVNWTAEHMKNTSVHCQCEDGWHLHVDKCYFFSEVDKSWDSANNTCASLNSTLAACVNPAERGFVLSQNWSLYLWIGPIEGRDGELRWPNGNTFNNRTCCYLNHNGFTYGSCHLKRQSICTKPAHCGEETE